MDALTADRRSFLLASAAAGLAVGPQWASAEEKDAERTAAELVTPATSKAIDRGLAYLATKQTEDGSFGSGCPNVAVCSLAGLAFLSGGNTPGRGPYGRNVQRFLDFVLEQAQESGFISEPSSSSHGPMYGHGFATLFLAECYGMSPRADLREHGDSMVPIWSSATVAGLPLERYPGWNAHLAGELFTRTKGSGAEVIKKKGGAGFAVGLAIQEVAEAIALDRRAVLPVSSVQKGCYGIRDVALSVPTVVGQAGVVATHEVDLWPKEVQALRNSSQVLRQTIDTVLSRVGAAR